MVYPGSWLMMQASGFALSSALLQPNIGGIEMEKPISQVTLIKIAARLDLLPQCPLVQNLIEGRHWQNQYRYHKVCHGQGSNQIVSHILERSLQGDGCHDARIAKYGGEDKGPQKQRGDDLVTQLHIWKRPRARAILARVPVGNHLHPIRVTAGRVAVVVACCYKIHNATTLRARLSQNSGGHATEKISRTQSVPQTAAAVRFTGVHRSYRVRAVALRTHDADVCEGFKFDRTASGTWLMALEDGV
ncbi:hypothetical protein FQN60_018449 [Etheostoma spectabile]|uniref:Uncharacterized protein n=1 Tax=Etheostoma spectabile TaxID=54343 RepID=A0A5J5DHZ3_9PERO|nr:hypothetical protein FQN60_018449 [Etheostoma spectabile]